MYNSDDNVLVAASTEIGFRPIVLSWQFCECCRRMMWLMPTVIHSSCWGSCRRSDIMIGSLNLEKDWVLELLIWLERQLHQVVNSHVFSQDVGYLHEGLSAREQTNVHDMFVIESCLIYIMYMCNQFKMSCTFESKVYISKLDSDCGLEACMQCVWAFMSVYVHVFTLPAVVISRKLPTRTQTEAVVGWCCAATISLFKFTYKIFLSKLICQFNLTQVQNLCWIWSIHVLFASQLIQWTMSSLYGLQETQCIQWTSMDSGHSMEYVISLYGLQLARFLHIY
jgi:hypothetical protein